MKRIHLKKKYKFKNLKINIFWLTIILLIVITILIFNFIGSKITPGTISYAESELEKLSSRIINKVISTKLNELNYDDLFSITRDSDNYVKTIDYNPKIVNNILSVITSNTESILRGVEKGDLSELSDDILKYYDINKLKKGILFEIAIFSVFDNPLITNIGPKIPVKISLLGNTNSNINTKITSFGINNALVETSIIVNINLEIILPYKTKKVSLNNSVMLFTKIIEGNIPNYYFNGTNKSSNSFIIPE